MNLAFGIGLTFTLALLCLFVRPALAKTSYHLAHPLGWMHMLPAGETPGWSQDLWTDFEVQHANIWNADLRMRKKDTGQEFYYHADYEQTSTLLEIGGAISERTALSIVVPYMARGGGVLDHMIDEFHVMIGSLRFNRALYEKDQYDFSIATDGQEQLTQLKSSGAGQVKLKMKNWWWKWQSLTPGACECGFSTGLQVKVPLSDARQGFTSGKLDYTFTLHVGIPIGDDHGIWFTSAFSYLSRPDILKDWPTQSWHKMYEVSSDWALDDSWGLVLNLRMDSPYLDKAPLEFVDDSYDSEQALLNRIASGWNALVHWRGSQSAGLRYRTLEGDEISLHFVEDWALGRYDQRGDRLYVNNAPDVAFVFKYHSSF